MATRIKPKQIRAGAENQVLTSVGGEPIWKAPATPTLDRSLVEQYAQAYLQTQVEDAAYLEVWDTGPGTVVAQRSNGALKLGSIEKQYNIDYNTDDSYATIQKAGMYTVSTAARCRDVFKEFALEFQVQRKTGKIERIGSEKYSNIVSKSNSNRGTDLSATFWLNEGDKVRPLVMNYDDTINSPTRVGSSHTDPANVRAYFTLVKVSGTKLLPNQGVELEKPRYADELPWTGGVIRETHNGMSVKVMRYQAQIPEKYTGRKVKITTNTAFNIQVDAGANTNLTPTIITELTLGSSRLFRRSHQKRPFHTEMDTIVALAMVGGSKGLNIKYIDRDNTLNTRATSTFQLPEEIKIIIETVD